MSPSNCRSVVLFASVFTLATAACGGDKLPPKTPDETTETATTKEPKQGGGPSISQELGSLDPKAVEQAFAKMLDTKLETCHKQGRERIEFMSGDAKVFLRVGQDGKVKYGHFEESTLGDRETEKCVLDALMAADWPKPQGGEGEIRSGFGWSPGSERQPASWGPEKVMTAIDGDHKSALEKCKGGVSGDFKVTAYVEPGEVEGVGAHGSGDGPGKSDGKGGGGKKGTGGGKKASKKGDKKGAPSKKTAGEHGGKFKAIGIAPPSKEGADKLDCLVDTLKTVSLPSPGSWAAKVSFSL